MTSSPGPEDRILAASLDTLRQMTIPQLEDERDSLRKHLEEAIEMAEEMIDAVIIEKRYALAIN